MQENKDNVTNENGSIIKFDKFKYGKENASCTIFMDEEKDVQRIDRTYLDEEFDKEDTINKNEKDRT